MKVTDTITNSKGATLIELIIVLAVLGILMTGVYSFFSFGLRTFAKGGRNSEIQHDVNQAAFYITNTIRNVKEISITSKAGYKHLNLQDKYPNIEAIEYQITHIGGDYFLEFVITREGHQVESKVLLNNVKSAVVGSDTSIWYLESISDPIATPQLSHLAVSDGALSPIFNPILTSYTVTLPPETTAVPVVTATGEENTSVNVTQATNVDGTLVERTAAVIVTSTEDTTKINIYKVVFTTEPLAQVELKAESVSGPNQSFQVFFNKKIVSVIEKPANTKAPVINDKAVTITINSGSFANNSDYIIKVIDLDGLAKRVTVKKVGGNSWELVD